MLRDDRSRRARRDGRALARRLRHRADRQRLRHRRRLEAARDVMRPFIALYIGGMGSRDKNFYNQLVQRYGFEDAAKKVQDLYLEGKKEEAAAALPDELIDLVSLGRPARARPRAAAAYQRRRRRHARRLPDGLDQGRAPRAAAAGRRVGGGRGLKVLLGAFGDPGHAFPIIALGRALQRARPRGRASDVDALARGRRARGHALRAGAGVPRVPHARAAAEALRGGACARRRTRARWSPRAARTSSSPTSSRSRPRWPPSWRACPWATLIPHVDPRAAPGFPPYSIGARLPRTARRPRVWWRCSTRSSTAGCEQGRARAQRDARRGSGLPPLEHVHGGISRELSLVATFPQLEYPRADGAAARTRTSSGRCSGSRRPATSSCRRATTPLVLVAPSTAQDPSGALLRAALAGLADLPVRVLATSNRRPPTAPLRRPGQRAPRRLGVLRAHDAAVRRRRLPRRPRHGHARADVAAASSSPARPRAT